VHNNVAFDTAFYALHIPNVHVTERNCRHTYIHTYIHTVDPGLVRMTVGYGIGHTPTRIRIHTQM
jgi:hypothetical protein